MKIVGRLRRRPGALARALAGPLAWAFAVVLGLAPGAGGRAGAQTIDYSITSSASSLLVSNPLTFTIEVTNLTGLPIANLVITDSLPASVQITSDNPDVTFYANYGSVATFSLLQFTPGQILQISLSTEPDQAGLITNTISISTPSLLTNSESSLVILVTNTLVIANLGVAITSPAQPVFTNDTTAYTLTVTNAGPDTAPAVFLTNTLPPGVILLGVAPASQSFTVTGGRAVFPLGTLGSGGQTSIQVTVEPTNAGVLPFSAGVGSTSVTNLSFLPTVATNSLDVITFIPGVLTAVTNSSQQLNYQNGLEEQSVLLSNASASAVSAARLVVTGLARQLYNAAGTNSGNPYVVLAAPLNAGEWTRLRLQFYPRGAFAFSNAQLQAYPVPFPNLTPPPVTGASASLKITGPYPLADGSLLLQFPALAGRSYTIVYSDNVRFSNAVMVLPAVSGGANFLQWIDFGPPGTVTPPAGAAARFYRVIQTP